MSPTYGQHTTQSWCNFCESTSFFLILAARLVHWSSEKVFHMYTRVRTPLTPISILLLFLDPPTSSLCTSALTFTANHSSKPVLKIDITMTPTGCQRRILGREASSPNFQLEHHHHSSSPPSHLRKRSKTNTPDIFIIVAALRRPSNLIKNVIYLVFPFQVGEVIALPFYLVQWSHCFDLGSF